MKKPFFVSLLFTHSLLQADDFAAFFMSATLFILLFTLIIALMLYLKNLQREMLTYSALFHHSDTPALFVDAKGAIRDMNESAQALLGYTKAQLIDRKWFESVLPHERSLQIEDRLYRADKKGGKSEFSAPLIRAGGELLETDFTLKKLPEPLKGSLLTLVSVRKRSPRYRDKEEGPHRLLDALTPE